MKELRDKIKKEYRIQKFMRLYRYNYDSQMVNSLAELAATYYQEGYHNGLKQHEAELEDKS